MRVKQRRQKREDGDGGAENDPQEVAGAREALMCAVEAVALVNENQEGDVDAVYAEQRWRLPLERAMAAANTYSLTRAKLIPVSAQGGQEPIDGGNNATEDAEVAELARLIASADASDHNRVRERLEAQKARKKEMKDNEMRHECPPQLEVQRTTAEDQLEARRDSHGRAVPLGRNVLGEHYAFYSSPLSYARGKTAAEIFARMKRAVREDIRTRDARRIAVLNQQERVRKQQLIDMGYIPPDAVLEARFDQLMRRESTDLAS